MTWQEEKKNTFYIHFIYYCLTTYLLSSHLRQEEAQICLCLVSTAENYIQFTFNTEFMLFSSVSHLSNFDSRLLLPSRKKSTQKKILPKKNIMINYVVENRN